jgi:hypothetical protein
MAGLGGFRTASRVSARDGASAAVGGQGQSERGNQVSVLVFNQHPFQARREEQSARHILAAARQNEICTLVWLDEGRQRLPAFEGDVRQIEPGLDVVQLGERCEVRAEQGEQLGIVWRDDWIRRVWHLAAGAGAGVGGSGPAVPAGRRHVDPLCRRYAGGAASSTRTSRSSCAGRSRSIALLQPSPSARSSSCQDGFVLIPRLAIRADTSARRDMILPQPCPVGPARRHRPFGQAGPSLSPICRLLLPADRLIYFAHAGDERSLPRPRGGRCRARAGHVQVRIRGARPVRLLNVRSSTSLRSSADIRLSALSVAMSSSPRQRTSPPP